MPDDSQPPVPQQPFTNPFAPPPTSAADLSASPTPPAASDMPQMPAEQAPSVPAAPFPPAPAPSMPQPGTMITPSPVTPAATSTQPTPAAADPSPVFSLQTAPAQPVATPTAPLEASTPLTPPGVPGIVEVPPITPAAPVPPVPPLPQPPVYPAGPNPAPKAQRWAPPSKNMPLIAGAGVLVVAILAAVFFWWYLPNTPTGMFDGSLTDTGVATDQLITYVNHRAATTYKSTNYDGTLTIKSPSGNWSGSLTGASDASGDTSAALNLTTGGQTGTANLRVVTPAGSTGPDIYVQLSQAITQALGSAGYPGLDSLSGQWVVFDHSLLDAYTTQLKNAGAGTSFAAPSAAQVADALQRMQVVNKQYLFTSDSNKAVLQEIAFKGTEKLNGRDANHYTVGFNKAHLSAYVTALQSALTSSKLNDWAQATTGQSLSQLMNANNTQAVQGATNGYHFDLWTDNATRLIAQVAFKTSDGSTNTVAQTYTGGASYPLSFTTTTPAALDSGGNQMSTLGIVFNTSTNAMTLTLGMVSGDSTVTATIHAKPSNTPVQITAPAGAKSFTDLLFSGLNGM